MARFKYYRYGMLDKGQIPKKGLIRMEHDWEFDGGELWGVAVYDRPLMMYEIEKHKFIDMNDPVRNLTRIRMHRGLKQKELSEAAGVPLRTLQGWELNGMQNAALGSAIKLADYLKCDVRDLLDPEDME